MSLRYPECVDEGMTFNIAFWNGGQITDFLSNPAFLFLLIIFYCLLFYLLFFLNSQSFLGGFQAISILQDAMNRHSQIRNITFTGYIIDACACLCYNLSCIFV